MNAAMSSMMPILQSLLQLGPEVDEIQAAPQAAPMMQQNNNQEAGLLTNFNSGTDSIAEALLGAPTTGGNTGALAKAKMAYDDTQSSRLPGMAGGIEGIVDMFRAGGKREALGNEMQTMADAQAAEAARLEAKTDAEKMSKAQAEEEIKRKRATVVMQMAVQSGMPEEQAMTLGDLAYGSEETAREIYGKLNPEASTFEKEANFINSQGGNLTPQEMEERFKRTGQNNTTIMNPPAPGYQNVPGGQEMIPGGPADVEHRLKLAQLEREEIEREEARANQLAAEQGARFEVAKTTRNKIMDLDESIEQVGRTLGYVGEGTTGLMGHFLSMVPGTDATQLQEFLKTQRGRLAFTELAQMREQSKTGGALGNVSNVELGLLEAAFTSLSTAKPEELQKSLMNVMEKFYSVKYGLENESRFMEETKGMDEGGAVKYMEQEMNRFVNERMAEQVGVTPEGLHRLYENNTKQAYDDFEDHFGYRPRELDILDTRQ